MAGLNDWWGEDEDTNTVKTQDDSPTDFNGYLDELEDKTRSKLIQRLADDLKQAEAKKAYEEDKKKAFNARPKTDGPVMWTGTGNLTFYDASSAPTAITTGTTITGSWFASPGTGSYRIMPMTGTARLVSNSTDVMDAVKHERDDAKAALQQAVELMIEALATNGLRGTEVRKQLIEFTERWGQK